MLRRFAFAALVLPLSLALGGCADDDSGAERPAADANASVTDLADLATKSGDLIVPPDLEPEVKPVADGGTDM